MKRTSILIAAVCGVLFVSGIVTAQVFLNPVLIQDFQSNGSNLRYFNKAPSVHKWNFTGIPAAVPAISGTTMTVPGVLQYGRSVDRPTCVSGLRGQFYTVESPNNGADGGTGGNSDGGIKDLTYQCCKAAAGTYSWVAVACQ